MFYRNCKINIYNKHKKCFSFDGTYVDEAIILGLFDGAAVDGACVEVLYNGTDIEWLFDEVQLYIQA